MDALTLIDKTLAAPLRLWQRLSGRTVPDGEASTRATLGAALAQARRLGVQPATVLDVGVADGTPELYAAFPEARYLLVEPLEEYLPYLRKIAAQLPRAEYVLAAAGRQAGSITINVHPDLVGSSFFREDEQSDVNGVERVVPVVTLDELCGERQAAAPFLIKVDVQGAELDVLAGAETILQDTALIILEVSFFEFFQGGPLIFDCLKFMDEHHFVAYDLFDLQYRLLDGALSQADIAFVPAHSPLRVSHVYATPQQRAAQNQAIREYLQRDRR